MSTGDGKVLADPRIGESVDATKTQAFVGCRDGTLTVAGERSPGKTVAGNRVASAG
jgi:hypothetical protein